MSTFATLYAYAKAMRLQPYLYRDQMEALSKYFPRVKEVMRVIEDTFCDPCDLPWQRFSAFLKSPIQKKDYERGRAFGMPSYHQNPSAYRDKLILVITMLTLDWG